MNTEKILFTVITLIDNDPKLRMRSILIFKENQDSLQITRSTFITCRIKKQGGRKNGSFPPASLIYVYVMEVEPLA